ncbi:YceD family protein [Piscinibacter sakaiensis]|uniref:YceD family protein n=1 Tax=Piscinibacter sakaiensis TaxID=1547922 RepID=UPI003AB0D4DA
MRERPFNPSRLDVRSFADRAAALEGDMPIRDLERLVASTHPESPPAADELVHWQASGEMRSAPGGDKQPWLLLQASGRVRLTCQRCLQAVEHAMQIDHEYRFVADESTAAALDIESDEDVLVESRSFDLPALIEDELLLSLPLVPRHEGSCPRPLQAPPDPVAAAIELAPPEKPFAVLARLKARKPEN